VKPEVVAKVVQENLSTENTKSAGFPLVIGVAGLKSNEDMPSASTELLNQSNNSSKSEDIAVTKQVKSTVKGSGLFAGLKISSTKLSKLSDANSEVDVDTPIKKMKGAEHINRPNLTSSEDQLKLLQNKNFKSSTKAIPAMYMANSEQDSKLIKLKKDEPAAILKESLFSDKAKSVESKAIIKDPLQAILSKDDVKSDNLLQHSGQNLFTVVKEGSQNSSQVGNTTMLQNIQNASPQEVINKIVEYIEQNSIIKNNSLNLTVHHKQLGQFDIAVTQNHQTKALDVMINSATQEGTHFFQANEHKLLAKLQTAGFELNDFKVVSRMAHVDAGRNSSESLFNNNNSGQSRGWSSHQQGSHQESADGQRRRELWEEYKERYYA
jgi:hypothetical protein